MPAISLKGIGKSYRVYPSRRHRLKELMSFGKKTHSHDFWALQDVSFDIEPGTTLGILGRNGAGKSTLLKVISGVLQPTTGSVEVNGRLAALFGVGAGFNPEFTGRENVFLNGAIMGIPEAVMRERFDQVASFAEIGEFIDRPVKTYSSGMYVRLAFATAIHVDPEILLVDEALAVGDIAFQHRCLRKIKELQSQGVTILFVSHDLGAVKSLCDQAALVVGGRVVELGEPGDIVKRYTALVMGESEERAVPQAEPIGAFRHGDGRARITEVAIVGEDGLSREAFQSTEPVKLRVGIEAKGDIAEPVVGFMLRNRLGVDVYGTNTDKLHLELPPLAGGEHVTVEYAFPMNLLDGVYSATVAVHSSDLTSHDWIDEALYFEVVGAPEALGLANLQATARALKGEPTR